MGAGVVGVSGGGWGVGGEGREVRGVKGESCGCAVSAEGIQGPLSASPRCFPPHYLQLYLFSNLPRPHRPPERSSV